MMAAAAAAPMEAQTTHPPSDVSSAAYPRWVMLQQEMKIELQGSSCSTETLAAARTSTGNLIQVSLRVTEPPGVSRVCLQIPAGRGATDCRVVAAHGDSMLIHVVLIEGLIEEDNDPDYTEDHFVYSTGAAAAAADPPRPPSLSLLPHFGFDHRLSGLVRRRGEDDVVVVGQVESVSAAGRDTPELMREANLSLFSSDQWSVKRLQIRFRDASHVPGRFPSSNAVFPVGDDGLLCWVSLDPWHLYVLLGDVLEETPKMQYLPLPTENIWGPPSNRNVCATAGGDALKFVNIFPRCCCGGVGASRCQRSCHAYTIETWTMRIGNCDDMGWVKDGMVDATEVWALDSYKGLRRFPLHHPVVSVDDPDLICFCLHEVPVDDCWNYRDRSVDMIMVNMRSKTIHSVSRYEDGLLQMRDGRHLIPSNISYFFNSNQSCGSDGTFTGQRQKGIDTAPPAMDDDDEPFVQASEIFNAFQEIPSFGLDDDEIIKAFGILSRDNCHQFRSFIRLPKNLRKDWLLMEIKAKEE